VPMIKARTPRSTQPTISNVLGTLEMMRVIPANAPRAIAVLQEGSEACMNLSSMEVVVSWKGAAQRLDQFC
jgi:hypothetical protein